MNILYELDKNFAPQVCTGVVSVCENNREVDDLRFFFFGLGLDEETSDNLRKTCAAYGREGIVIPIDGFMDDFDGFDTTGWNEVVLSRLLVDRFLPDDVNRILHLDGDTIVRGSLLPFWEEELAPDYVIGAVIEATVDRSRIAALGLENEPYFNAGVLLIDLQTWRREGDEQVILSYCAKNAQLLFANDQDAINAVFAGRIKPVAPSYNWCNSYVFYPYRVLKRLMGNVPYYDREVFENAVKNPVIVHYLGEERPWRTGNTHRYRDEYQHYLSLTPYANAPEESGWESYFRVWSLFNTLMRPFPMLRYRIITALIPKMMAWRKRVRSRSAVTS